MCGRPSKYSEVLRDREVARWYGQVSQGSKKTAWLASPSQPFLGTSCYPSLKADIRILLCRSVREVIGGSGRGFRQ